MLKKYIDQFNIKVNGILHVGANYIQEQDEYEKITDNENIYWIEANPEIVEDIKKNKPYINIFQGLITDKNDDLIKFNISNNNSLSSSIYEFGTHFTSHPDVTYINSIYLKTQTLDSFVNLNINNNVPNILILDTQGSEFLILKGASNLLKNVDLIYTEINTGDTYKGCIHVDAIDKLLSNYNLHKIYQNIWENHTYGDALYIKKKI